MMIEYNDNELLYLISEGELIATDILFNKYSSLIKKRIHLFKIQSRYRDDFYQEGLMVLNNAINTYLDYYGKTFNKYFDLILQRHYMNLLQKDVNYFYNVTLVDDFDVFPSVLKEEEKEITYENHFEEEIDQKIYNMLLDGYRPKEISDKLGIDIKSLYNRTYKIKKTLKIFNIDKR